MSKLTGAEIVVGCLKKQGVGTVFGYPSGAILNMYGALYRHQDKITHVPTSYEQGTSHTADGYARATNRVGVCLATSGPGATNLVTGITTAYMDSVSVVAVTCNVTSSLLSKDSFREIDITGVTIPITKYNFIVKDASRLATVIRGAFTTAQTDHPDPVLVDVIKGVAAVPRKYKEQVPGEIVRQDDTITEQDMDRVMEMIRKASKPFIFVGGGTMLTNVSDELRAFTHKIQAPVADSLMGKDAFDGTDELYTGMVGMHGTKTSNFGITEADLLIVVDAGFSDRVTGDASKLAENTKILQLDIDPAEINKNTKVDVSIIGDMKVILRRLNARLDPVSHDEWIAHIKHMEDMYPLRYDKNLLAGPFIVQTINEVTNGDAVIVAEVGRHWMWTAQYYQYRQPHTLFTSGRLGIMGYGLGATIGAKMGCRDKTAINIAGGGCFHIDTNKVATTTRYNTSMVEVIVNNHMLGMVRQWQTLFYGKRYSQTIPNDSVNLVEIAEAMEARACRVVQKEELEPVLREAISLNIPVVIDCQISCDDKISPMVSPGAPITDAFDDTDLKIN